MRSETRPKAVLAVSAQPSITTFLRNILQDAGFDAFALNDACDSDVVRMVQEIQADAILYDIGFPFARNWEALNRLRSHGALSGVPVVVTTPDARALSRQVGFKGAIELFRRPADLAAFRDAVLAAIEEAKPVHAG
jgi:DNA-binding response OmpR family regulator